MEIVVGKYSGFCNGVANAVNRANEVIDKYHEVYSLGEIVHNEDVVLTLVKKGMKIINSIEDVPEKSKVIIRAHGEKKEVYNYANSHNIELIDLTCPKVKFIRDKINNYRNEYFIVIIGKKNHPETISNLSFALPNGMIVESSDDIISLCNEFKKSKLKGIYIVSQTTITKDMYDNLVNEIKCSINTSFILDMTICMATEMRQEETIKIAKSVSKMIVVGSKTSFNTMELFNMAKRYLDQVYLVSYDSKIDFSIFKDDKVGIVAGASTPKEVIMKIIDKIR